MRVMTAVLVLAGLSAGACTDYLPDVGEPFVGACDPADSNPAASVSFERDLRPLFDRPRGMAGCSCHTPTNGSPSGIELGGFNMGSLRSLKQGGRNSGARVVEPGDPCASILYQKISDTPPFGSRMPLDGSPYLAPEEIQLIHDWIAEGANDN